MNNQIILLYDFERGDKSIILKDLSTGKSQLDFQPRCHQILINRQGLVSIDDSRLDFQPRIQTDKEGYT